MQDEIYQKSKTFFLRAKKNQSIKLAYLLIIYKIITYNQILLTYNNTDIFYIQYYKENCYK